MIEKSHFMKLLGDSKSIPSLPHVVFRINTMVQNPRVSASDVANVIKVDPAMTSHVLKVVNSAYYGFPSQISSIPHAIAILGFNAIQKMAINVFVTRTFGNDKQKEEEGRTGLWDHSVATAVAAKLIAQEIKYKDLDEAFTAALLHDMGKMILDQYMNPVFAKVAEKVEAENISMLEAEQKLLGFGHDLIGKWLSQQWMLPKALIEPIALHHNTANSKEAYALTYTVHLADIVARTAGIGNGGDPLIPLPQEAVAAPFQELDVPAFISRITEKLPSEMYQAIEFMLAKS